MKRKHWELTLIFILLVVLFATFLAIPAIRLLVKSFWGETGLTTEFYTSVLTAPQFGTALRNSFAVSAASALLAVGIAFVMAYLIHYTRLPRGIRRAIQAVAHLLIVGNSAVKLLRSFMKIRTQRQKQIVAHLFPIDKNLKNAKTRYRDLRRGHFRKTQRLPDHRRTAGSPGGNPLCSG